MKVLFKTEMNRAFFSKEMAISLILGIGIMIWHLLQFVLFKTIYDSGFDFCPKSVYYHWIGANCYPTQSYLYFLILPLIATLPAGGSLYVDLKNGYVKHVVLRSNQPSYFRAKYWAAFFSGGFAFCIPLLFNYLATALCLPLLRPEAITSVGPLCGSFDYELFYHHPFVHTLLFILIDFIFAGGMVIFALLASFYAKYRVIILLIPFVIYYMLFSINNFLPGDIAVSPNYFLLPGFDRKYIWEFILSLIVFIAVSLVYEWKGRRYECM